MKIYVIVVTILALVFCGFANDSQWLALQSSVSQPASPQMTNFSTSPGGLVFSYEIPGLLTSKVPVNNQVFDNITIPGWGKTRQIGKPALPVIHKFIAVPQGASVTVRLIQDDVDVLSDYYLFPAQPSQFDSYDVSEPEFTIDKEFYSQDMVYPQRVVGTSDIASMRGVSTVLLTVKPIQYNPKQRKLIVHKRF